MYLVHDTLLDRDVAFALIKTEGLDDAGRQRILREAQTMGKLSDHQNIVPLYDLGDEAGQPYMVLPVLQGGDVERLIDKALDHRLPIDRTIKIAKGICRGLVSAHSMSIIHRDLKPGNIWLGSDGTAKIGDFGLAIAPDRTRLTQEGAMVGTVWYIPPEQAMGANVDHRSDLYALGAMMYEMVTGRPPFIGDDSVSIISQHINTPPVAPSWHNSQCPPLLEKVILRLLAKNPGERYASAEDVLAALEAIDADVDLEQAAPERRKIRVLEDADSGIFVGRRQEMGKLKGALEDTLSGRGQLAIITGDPGTDKTRTTMELATYASLRGVQVLWGRCHEPSGAPAYWPWVQAIRSYVQDRDTEQLSSEMGTGATYISDILPDLRERLPEMGEPVSTDPAQAQFQLFDSIANFLTRAARSQPLMIALDDLHWADQASLMLLEFLARELGGMRLLIAATYREMEVSHAHPLSQTLSNLVGRGMVHRITLRGVSRADVGEFVHLSAGISPPEGLIDAVYGYTEGNPLVLTEVVRLMGQEDELTEEAVGKKRKWKIKTPDAVRDLVGRRLERLSDQCIGVLRVATVLGRQFEADLLSRLDEGTSGENLLEALEEAVAMRTIEEVPASPGAYRFTHGLIQERLAAEVPAARRSELEEVISGARVAELTGQFTDTADVKGAQTVVREALAGERALANNAYEEAMVHFEKALRAKDGQEVDAETAALMFGMGRAQAATMEASKLGEAVSNLSRAFDYYEKVGDVDRAVGAADYLPIAKGTADVLTRALKLVGPDSYEAGRLLPTYGIALGIEEGKYEDAQTAFDRARAIAEQREDAALDLRAVASAAHVDAQHLKWQQSMEKDLKAIEMARRASEPNSEVLARVDAATALFVMGDPEAAALHAAAGLTIAEKVQERQRQADALWVNETVSRLRGKWSAARDLGERGMSVCPGDSRLLATRVLVEYETGEFEQGELYVGKLLEALRTTVQASTQGQAFQSMVIPLAARISTETGLLKIARQAAERVLSESSTTPQVAEMARAGLGMIAVIKGDEAQATELHDALLPLKDAFMPVGMAGDRLLGLLAMTMGDIDGALGHFDDALAFCLRAWYKPEYAWGCHDYGEALLKRGGEGDHEEAKSHLSKSLDVARELGMRPLTERVEALL